MKLKMEFYRRSDVVLIARELLGKYLLTNINGVITGGKIIETEAYEGITDKASHAFNDRRTLRTEVMYEKGGCSYVYLCYGIHYLFNVVTNVKDIPHAVLIRAIEPSDGLSKIYQRTGKNSLKDICNGPGKLTRALGIDMDFNNLRLDGNKIWIEDRGEEVKDTRIIKSKRIGVDYAGEDADLLYRFNLEK